MIDNPITSNLAKADVLDPEMAEATRKAEAQLDRDPFKEIRALLGAIREIIAELSPPMMKNAILAQVNETEVFKLVTMLEAKGFRIVAIPKST